MAAPDHQSVPLPPSPPLTPLPTGQAKSGSPVGPSDNPSQTMTCDPGQIALPFDIDTAEYDGENQQQSDKAPAPASIPLPASPAPNARTEFAKHSLPFRPPPTAFNRSRRLTSNARTASGRRVSGALQYALQPQVEREVSDSMSLDLAYYEEMREQVSDLEVEEGESEVLDHVPTWDSSLGFGGVAMTGDDAAPLQNQDGQFGIGEDEDEAWMAYVRQQLNTLFPDLFNADPPSHPHPTQVGSQQVYEGDSLGELSISTISTSELPTPPPSAPIGHLGYNRVLGDGAGAVPNVREEIGGLRDEIERLRGVVSGLAEGMRLPAVDAERTLGPVERPPAQLAAGDEVKLPDSFLKTADMTMEIIRVLDSKVRGSRPGSDGLDDDEVFSHDNLSALKERLEALSI